MRMIGKLARPALGAALIAGGLIPSGAEAVDVAGVDVHALISTTYNYSLSEPDGSGDDIGMRIYNKNHNTFDLRDAVLTFGRMKDDEDFGFKIVTDFGKAAVRGNGTDWDGDGSTADTADNIFDLREAYGTYKLPLEIPSSGKKPTLKVGKHVTLLGREVLLDPSTGGYNDNITMSYLSGFSIPFTHIGAMLDLPLHDMVTLTLGVVNGNDVVRDNNDGKTLHAGLGIVPSEMVSMYIATVVGPESLPRAEGGLGAGSKTAILTANVAVKPIDQLTLVLDGTFADVSDAVGTNLDDSANWYGGAFYAIVGITDQIKFTFRTEVFDDPDGVKVPGVAGPLPNTTVPKGATLWEVSPAVSFWFNDHILTRVEYRHDEASRPIFPADNGKTWSGQDTIGVELLLTL